MNEWSSHNFHYYYLFIFSRQSDNYMQDLKLVYMTDKLGTDPSIKASEPHIFIRVNYACQDFFWMDTDPCLFICFVLFCFVFLLFLVWTRFPDSYVRLCINLADRVSAVPYAYSH